jgi:hypothetical protein
MQIGSYECFDEPLTEEEVAFIKKFNRLFNPPSSPLEYGKPTIKLIYKPFNFIEYEHEGEVKVDYNPDLPPFKYSLGWKVTMPSIPQDAPEGIKRVARKIGIIC